MTISTPSLPPDSLPAGANAAAPDAGPTDAPADGFAQFMTGEKPATEPADATDTPNENAQEQAAVLAASLLWAPLPLLVATPPPNLVPESGLAPASNPAAALEGNAMPTEVIPAGAEQTGVSLSQDPDAARASCPTAEREVSGMNPDRPEPVAAPSTETAESETNFEAALSAMEPAVAPVSTPAEQAAMRRLFRVSGRGEKIADPLNDPARELPSAELKTAKTFVSATQQEGRGEEEIVGTGVAKSGSEMPSIVADHHSSLAMPVSTAHVAVDGQPSAFDLTASTEPAERARSAVEAVMEVIDAQEQPVNAAARSVNLDFNFGDERLAVRVEFRDGAVRAHFRTQSLELRAALAQEWSQVAAAPENVLRLAEPVFVTSSRAEQPASFNADGGAGRQQSQQGQAPAHSVRPAPVGFAAAPAAALAEAPRLRHLPTTRHLLAVA